MGWVSGNVSITLFSSRPVGGWIVGEESLFKAAALVLSLKIIWGI